MRTTIYLLLFLGIVFNSAAQLAENQKAFDAKVSSIQAKFGKQRESLFDKYVKSLGKLQADAEKSGDLKGALAVRKEIKSASENRAVGTDPYPTSKKFRKILTDRLAKISAAEKRELNKLRRAYVAQLEKLIPSLTKSGALDEATEMAVELKKQRAQLVKVAKQDKPATEETKPVEGVIYTKTIDRGIVYLNGNQVVRHPDLNLAHSKRLELKAGDSLVVEMTRYREKRGFKMAFLPTGADRPITFRRSQFRCIDDKVVREITPKMFDELPRRPLRVNRSDEAFEFENKSEWMWGNEKNDDDRTVLIGTILEAKNLE